jgi:lysyl-tRNA synthetase class 2
MSELTELARAHQVVIPESLAADDRDGWLNLLLAELVEPHLGIDRPEFLLDYPASQAALATIRRENPAVAERFELYLGGIEVCNGYHELTDPSELRRRIDSESQRRAATEDEALPPFSRLLAAMNAGLPACAGVALGFDRLMMLVTGAGSVAEVVPFPFDRA